MPAKRPYPRLQQDFSGDSLTQTHFTDEVNVNNIVERYDATGIDPYAERKAAETYGDGSYREYLDAMLAVAELRSQFHELPQAAQTAFNNDPQAWLDAIVAKGQEPPPDTTESVSDPLTPPPEDAKTLDKGGE